MTDDDQDTPPIRLATDETMPRDFAGPDAQDLLHLRQFERQVDALRQEMREQGRQVGSLLASRDSNRKILFLVIPALVGALATVMVFAAEKIAASSERAGRVEATLDSEREARQKLEREVGELRDVLLRRLGIGEPHKPTSIDDALPPPLDKLSIFGHRLDGHGVGAALVASGRVLRHVPKLQNGHDLVVPPVHSMLELQVVPHRLLGLTTGDDAHPATRMANPMNLSIPEM